jgi:hypothetical protein
MPITHATRRTSSAQIIDSKIQFNDYTFDTPNSNADKRLLKNNQNLIMQCDAHRFADALAAAGISLDV